MLLSCQPQAELALEALPGQMQLMLDVAACAARQRGADSTVCFHSATAGTALTLNVKTGLRARDRGASGVTTRRRFSCPNSAEGCEALCMLRLPDAPPPTAASLRSPGLGRDPASDPLGCCCCGAGRSRGRPPRSSWRDAASSGCQGPSCLGWGCGRGTVSTAGACLWSCFCCDCWAGRPSLPCSVPS